MQIINASDYAQNVLSFTYCGASQKIVFINRQSRESQRLFLLLHEIGHIFLGHSGSDNILGTDNKQLEVDADMFALAAMKAEKPKFVIESRSNQQIVSECALIRKMNQRARKKKILRAIALALFLTSFILATTYLLKSKGQAVPPHMAISPEQTATISPQNDEQLDKTDAQDKSIQEQALLSPDTAVQVAREGTVYHLPGCSYIKGKENLTSMTVAEAESKGYKLCSRCRSKIF